MSLRGRTVVVAGGGIAGMAAALLLAKTGALVTVVERVAAPEAVGAGLVLQPNGLAVLRALGLGGELERGSHRLVDGIALRDARGAVLLYPTVRDFGFGLDHVLAVRRSHLYGVLLAAVQACPTVSARLGVEVIRAHPDGRVEISGRSGTRVVTGSTVSTGPGWACSGGSPSTAPAPTCSPRRTLQPWRMRLPGVTCPPSARCGPERSRPLARRWIGLRPGRSCW